MNILNTIKNQLYGEGVNVPLSDDEIISVCLTFPGALVAACDGNFDDDERLVMLDISETLGESDVASDSKARLASAERYRAFMWLLDNKKDVEDIIFSGIREIISNDDQASVNLVSMLHEVAETSDGISNIEMEEIKRICELLGIQASLN